MLNWYYALKIKKFQQFAFFLTRLDMQFIMLCKLIATLLNPGCAGYGGTIYGVNPKFELW